MYVEGCNLAAYKQHRNKSALTVAGEIYLLRELSEKTHENSDYTVAIMRFTDSTIY